MVQTRTQILKMLGLLSLPLLSSVSTPVPTQSPTAITTKRLHYESSVLNCSVGLGGFGTTGDVIIRRTDGRHVDLRGVLTQSVALTPGSISARIGSTELDAILDTADDEMVEADCIVQARYMNPA